MHDQTEVGTRVTAAQRQLGGVRPDPAQRWLSVTEAAQQLGLSDMTLYRAIRAGEFPAVKIRGRLIVPSRALDEMGAAASAHGGRVVDAAAWVPGSPQAQVAR